MTTMLRIVEFWPNIRTFLCERLIKNSESWEIIVSFDSTFDVWKDQTLKVRRFWALFRFNMIFYRSQKWFRKIIQYFLLFWTFSKDLHYSSLLEPKNLWQNDALNRFYEETEHSWRCKTTQREFLMDYKEKLNACRVYPVWIRTE